MIVRKATLEDIPKIIPLWKGLEESINSLIKDYPILIEYGKLRSDAADVFERDLKANMEKDGHFHIVAEDNGKLMGYITAYIKNRGKEKVVDKVMYLHHIMVADEARNTGVGSALVKELEKITKDKGIEFIILKTYHTNTQSQNFYLKNGYEKRFIEMVKKV
jgi:ribosomal protein S18 acetylase RimI-like enzyme